MCLCMLPFSFLSEILLMTVLQLQTVTFPSCLCLQSATSPCNCRVSVITDAMSEMDGMSKTHKLFIFHHSPWFIDPSHVKDVCDVCKGFITRVKAFGCRFVSGDDFQWICYSYRFMYMLTVMCITPNKIMMYGCTFGFLHKGLLDYVDFVVFLYLVCRYIYTGHRV